MYFIELESKGGVIEITLCVWFCPVSIAWSA